MSTASQTISIIRDPLAQAIKGALDGLVDGNIDGIANEVAQSDDGNLTVSFSVKLTLSCMRVAGTGRISYSRKFTDESEFMTPDPNQPPLPFRDGAETSHADAASLRKGIQAVDRALAAGMTPDDVSMAIKMAKAASRSGDKARSRVEEVGVS
jgi:hypothetical protein